MTFNHYLKYQSFPLNANYQPNINNIPRIKFNSSSENKYYHEFNDVSNQKQMQLDQSSLPAITDSKRLKFSAAEDDILRREIALHGARKWDQIALSLPGRNGKQCRDRFQNYLNPTLTNGPWTKEEDKLLTQKVNEFGQHWNSISKFFNGRSSNNVKNRWYTYFCKKHGKTSSVLNKSIDNESKIVENHEIEENRSDIVSINSIIDENSNNNIEENYVLNCPNECNKLNFLLNDEIHSNRMPEEISKNNIILPKSKKISKILFPPIYPSSNSFVFPLNLGLFDFLNREIS